MPARARSATSGARPDRVRSLARAFRRASPTSRPPCPCRACPCRRRAARRGSRAGAGCRARRRSRRSAPPCPGRPSSRRSRSTGGVITPRSSAISGSAPSSLRAASKTAAPGPRRQRPARGRARACGHRPVRDEAAEVVDAGEVGQLARSSQALDPPAVAVASQRGPVVERVAPQLPGGAERVRRGTRHDAALEEPGVGAVIGAARPDVERDVADQTDASRRRVLAQRASTRARSAPEPRRLPPGKARPVVDPVRVRVAKGRRARLPPTAASGSASRPGQAANADVEVYGEPERSGGSSGRTCHQDWPAAASQSTNA